MQRQLDVRAWDAHKWCHSIECPMFQGDQAYEYNEEMCMLFSFSFPFFLPRFHVLLHFCTVFTFVSFSFVCYIWQNTTPMDKLDLQRFGCFATAAPGCASLVIPMTKPPTVYFIINLLFIIYHVILPLYLTLQQRVRLLPTSFLVFSFLFVIFVFFYL